MEGTLGPNCTKDENADDGKLRVVCFCAERDWNGFLTKPSKHLAKTGGSTRKFGGWLQTFKVKLVFVLSYQCRLRAGVYPLINLELNEFWQS